MKLMKKIISIIFVLMLFTSISFAQPFEYATYSGKQIKISWSLDPNFTSYEVRIKNISSLEYYNFDAVTTDSITVTILKLGVYEAQVRMCKDIEGVYSCTAWSVSTNPSVSTVDGSSKAWVVRAKIEPPGEPVFEKL